jgi:predicted nucleotidyltransferase
MTAMHRDFKEFLKLLKERKIRYLLIGGYAVIYYGYPRMTADMDIWIEKTKDNAEKLLQAIIDFGFNPPELSPIIFLSDNAIIRMGIKPFMIELLNDISGVSFDDCYERKTTGLIDGIEVDLISLEDLLINKKAAGRLKDLSDIESLQ